MSEPFIGEIRIWGCTYNPQGWAYCNGTQLNVAQNPALYSLIGNTYGGTAQQNFKVPNLLGQIPVGTGQASRLGAGLPFTCGTTVGNTSASLTSIAQIPVHTHGMNVVVTPATSSTPSSTQMFAIAKQSTGNVAVRPYTTVAPDVQLSQAALGPACGNASGLADPHENRQPFQTFNYCIALTGVYPTFN